MNSFLELVLHRQSDRAYDANRPVEKEKLEQIIEAARLAPSACNAQPWHFIVVDDFELKNKIADATSSKVLMMNHFTKQAPIHIVIVEEKANISSSFGGWVKRKHFPHIDLGIVAEHIALAAADQGLGSCILGWFDEKKIKTLLNIPSSKTPLLILTLGYSTQETREKKRKPLNDVLSFNSYKK
jgi:nitroreductase